MGKDPIGVLEDVLIRSVEVHVGVQEVGIKDPVVLAGRPEIEKKTGVVLPESKVAVRVLTVVLPCVTALSPPLLNAKSNNGE